MNKVILQFKNLSILQTVTIVISFILLIISTTQPAFYIDRPNEADAWSDSLLLLLFGWTSFLGGNFLATLIWLANPLYFYSVIETIKGKRKGLYLSILATLTAFSFSMLESIMTSESGSYSKIASLELGYKLWLISFIVMSLGTSVNEFVLKSKFKLRNS